MAQMAEDVDDEDNLQYFCHACDAVVTEIEYLDDGDIQCTSCGVQGCIEILEPEEDDTPPPNTSTNAPNNAMNNNPNASNGSNSNAPNTNPHSNANGQFFYFGNGQPVQMQMSFSNIQHSNGMPNIGQILNQTFQAINTHFPHPNQPNPNGNNPNNPNIGNVHNVPYPLLNLNVPNAPNLNGQQHQNQQQRQQHQQQRQQMIFQQMNQAMNQGMNMMFNNVNMNGIGGFINQMMDPDRGPPATSTETINALPEYEYVGSGKGDDNGSDSETHSESDDEDMISEPISDGMTIEGVDDKDCGDSAQSKDGDVMDHEVHDPHPIAVNECKSDDLDPLNPSNPTNPANPSNLSNPENSQNPSDSTMEIEEEKETETSDDGTKNRECAVCKERFRKGDLLKELPCKHRYHKECIMPWITKRNTCPTCRYRLPTDNAFYEQMQNARENRNNAMNGNGPANGPANGPPNGPFNGPANGPMNGGNFNFNINGVPAQGVPFNAFFNQIFGNRMNSPQNQQASNVNQNGNVNPNGNSNGNSNGNPSSNQ